MKVLLSIVVLMILHSCGKHKTDSSFPVTLQKETISKETPEEKIRAKYAPMSIENLSTEIDDLNTIVQKEKVELCNSATFTCINRYKSLSKLLFELDIALEYLINLIDNNDEERKIEALSLKKTVKEAYKDALIEIDNITKHIEKDKHILLNEITITVAEIDSTGLCHVLSRSCIFPEEMTPDDIVKISNIVSKLKLIDKATESYDHGGDVIESIWGKKLNELPTNIHLNPIYYMLRDIEDSLNFININYSKLVERVKLKLKSEDLLAQSEGDFSIMMNSSVSDHLNLSTYNLTALHSSLTKIKYFEEEFFPYFDILKSNIKKKINYIWLSVALPNAITKKHTKTLYLSVYATINDQVSFANAYAEFKTIQSKSKYEIFIGNHWNQDIFGASEAKPYTNYLRDIVKNYNSGLIDKLVNKFTHIKISEVRFVFKDDSFYKDIVKIWSSEKQSEIYISNKTISEVIQSYLNN